MSGAFVERMTTCLLRPPARDVQSDRDVSGGIHDSSERGDDIDLAGLTTRSLLHITGRTKEQHRGGTSDIECSYEIEVFFRIYFNMAHPGDHDRHLFEDASSSATWLTEGAGELHHGGIASQTSAQVLRERAVHPDRRSSTTVAMPHEQTHTDAHRDHDKDDEDADHWVLTRATDHSAMRAKQSDVIADSAWAKPGSIHVVTSTPLARALASMARGCSRGK